MCRFSLKSNSSKIWESDCAMILIDLHLSARLPGKGISIIVQSGVCGNQAVVPCTAPSQYQTNYALPPVNVKPIGTCLCKCLGGVHCGNVTESGLFYRTNTRSNQTKDSKFKNFANSLLFFYKAEGLGGRVGETELRDLEGGRERKTDSEEERVPGDMYHG